MNIPSAVFYYSLREGSIDRSNLELELMRARLLSEDPPEYVLQGCTGDNLIGLDQALLLKQEGKIYEFLYNNQGKIFSIPEVFSIAQEKLKVSERAVSGALTYLEGWLCRKGNNRLITEEAKIGFRENRLVVV